MEDMNRQQRTETSLRIRTMLQLNCCSAPGTVGEGPSEAAEIALVENATVAWQIAFQSIPFKQGDVILTAEASYASNYMNFLLWKERYG